MLPEGDVEESRVVGAEADEDRRAALDDLGHHCRSVEVDVDDGGHAAGNTQDVVRNLAGEPEVACMEELLEIRAGPRFVGSRDADEGRVRFV